MTDSPAPESWICAECGDSHRCAACLKRRPARSDADRAAVSRALAQRADARRTPSPPPIEREILHLVASVAAIAGHAGLIGLCAAAAVAEVRDFPGIGVAWVYLIVGVVGVIGAWRSAIGLVSGTWEAIRAGVVTAVVVGVMVGVYPFLTWGRSGP